MRDRLAGYVRTDAILLKTNPSVNIQRGDRLMNKLVLGFFRTLAVGGCLLLSACVLIHSSAISESTGGGSAVNAEHSDYGILHLTAPVSLTSDANATLAKQCQSGMLSDVQTELSMRDWFLIVQYYTVTATAVCK
jgi:hypothetical protein